MQSYDGPVDPPTLPKITADNHRRQKGVVTLAIALVLTAVFALCLVSALQLLEPRDMPFGVTGSSPVVSAVQQEAPDALDLIDYSSESD